MYLKLYKIIIVFLSAHSIYNIRIIKTYTVHIFTEAIGKPERVTFFWKYQTTDSIKIQVLKLMQYILLLWSHSERPFILDIVIPRTRYRFSTSLDPETIFFIIILILLRNTCLMCRCWINTRYNNNKINTHNGR